MGYINKPICSSLYANTGFGDCYFDPALIKGAIKVPSTFSIAEANVAALQTYLQDAAWDDSPASRIFPVHNFGALTDNTEAPTIQTKGYGAKKLVRDGYIDWTFEYTMGGPVFNGELRKYNGGGSYWIFYDENGALIGRNDNGSLKGIPMEIFYVPTWKPADGSNAASYFIQFSFDPKYINQQVGFLAADFDVSEVVGLQDVVLSVYNSATNVHKIQAVTRISGVNLYDAGFDTELAAAGQWTATNDQTGAAFTITTVAADAAGSGFTVTLDTTAWTALTTGDTVTINLDVPSALQTAGVPGYEGVEVQVTK
jgi:hypothetical protein